MRLSLLLVICLVDSNDTIKSNDQCMTKCRDIECSHTSFCQSWLDAPTCFGLVEIGPGVACSALDSSLCNGPSMACSETVTTLSSQKLFPIRPYNSTEIPPGEYCAFINDTVLALHVDSTRLITAGIVLKGRLWATDFYYFQDQPMSRISIRQFDNHGLVLKQQTTLFTYVNSSGGFDLTFSGINLQASQEVCKDKRWKKRWDIERPSGNFCLPCIGPLERIGFCRSGGNIQLTFKEKTLDFGYLSGIAWELLGGSIIKMTGGDDSAEAVEYLMNGIPEKLKFKMFDIFMKFVFIRYSQNSKNLSITSNGHNLTGKAELCASADLTGGFCGELFTENQAIEIIFYGSFATFKLYRDTKQVNEDSCSIPTEFYLSADLIVFVRGRAFIQCIRGIDDHIDINSVSFTIEKKTNTLLLSYNVPSGSRASKLTPC